MAWLLAVGWIIAVGQQTVAAEITASTAARQATAILEAAGIHGGLVVHLGCSDGSMTAALHQNESYLIHGLDANAANVEKARNHIRSLGLYGKVSIEQFEGARLPYTDNLVNLLIVSSPLSIDREELLRVLCPGGAAITMGATGVSPVLRLQHGQDARGTRQTRIDKTLVKPWPEEIDHWTHYLHDASGNAVANDARAGVPRHAQWIAAPLWPRSHEYTPSISALVSSGGRIFYIMDDGPRGMFDSRFPERWAVYARDAFNGVLLWKRPFSGWGPTEWKASGHWSTPMSLPRRLVSTSNRVYVTLGYRAAVSVLDATTGEIVDSYDQTKNADEIVLQGGTLLARCRKGATKGSGLFNANHPSGRSGKRVLTPLSHMRCDWTRGECSYGVMPANGLLYVPPHPCVCYTGVALNGFNAFAAQRRIAGKATCGAGVPPAQCSRDGRTTNAEVIVPAFRSVTDEAETTEKKRRLERGLAYEDGDPPPSDSALGLSVDWPMHRHDPSRSGSTTCVVPVDVQSRWTVRVGGRLTQSVIAEEKVFIASVDEHTVYCLDAQTGHRSWNFTAGGRVDSAPTLHDGLAYRRTIPTPPWRAERERNCGPSRLKTESSWPSGNWRCRRYLTA